jgi:NAD(P)-dependent dehydrogenase (short-subunit alcohol dehydrogenase family)
MMHEMVRAAHLVPSMAESVRPSGRLAGLVCLVTGGGSGIGRATAIRFAEEGALVGVADIDLGAAVDTVGCLATPDVASAVEVDVTEPASVEQAVGHIVDDWGRIDVLFNNAGVPGVGTVEETSLEQWERVMAVNVRGVFLVARAVLPLMVAAGRGSIINMSSTIAEIGLARRAAYAASKGAVMALTRQMQADYAQHGIRVNALLPGTIHTPFVDRYLAESYDDPAAGLEALRQRQLTGELGRPEDVAAAAVFLASDESRFVLGTGLFVDGGVRGAK